MDLPRQISGSFTHRISASKRDFNSSSYSLAEEQKPKHNFVGARDPKILRKSESKGAFSKRNLVDKADLKIDRRTSHQTVPVFREAQLNQGLTQSVSTSHMPNFRETVQENSALTF